MSLNAETYWQLIQNPSLLDTEHIFELEKIVLEYPFFQSAKALHLKSLYHQNSPRYNHWLKNTAASTTDRSILFEFIISVEFKALPIQESDKSFLLEEEIIENKETIFDTIEIEATPKNINDENVHVENIHENNIETIEHKSEFSLNETSIIEEKLSIGAPLVFDAKEEHSFEEWLQLTKIKPIDRTASKSEAEINEIEVSNPEPVISTFEEKVSIIEKFIKENPKIKPQKDYSLSANVKTAPQDTNSLMTETLAKVYLEQKKYQKAIQAYQILILKYPEKSYLFADRIQDIKILQQNNS